MRKAQDIKELRDRLIGLKRQTAIGWSITFIYDGADDDSDGQDSVEKDALTTPDNVVQQNSGVVDGVHSANY